MFKWYGFVGILLILLTELNFFFRIEPLLNFAFIFLWYGYILLMDAVVYKLRGESLISNRFNQFIGMTFISAGFWTLFEFFNYFLRNWNYAGLEVFGFGTCSELFCLYDLIAVVSFMTVLPAFFETVEVILSLHLFDSLKFKTRFKINHAFLVGMIVTGAIFSFLVITIPQFTFPLVWLGVFLILDPINYMHKQPSIIGHVKKREWTIIASLLVAGIFVGFIWEFWNFWAEVKWHYTVPFVDFLHVFEMPVLGYLGYFPFALELYAMYWFTRSLFSGKPDKLLK